jgi:hypothetical protein
MRQEGDETIWARSNFQPKRQLRGIPPQPTQQTAVWQVASRAPSEWASEEARSSQLD